MRTRKVFTLILAAATLAALAFSGHSAMAAGGHDRAPKHGGIVTEAGHMDIELVVKPEAVQLHVRDHGKPVKLDGASAKVTLLAGAVKTEAALTPAGDRLEATGAFKPAAGVKAVAVIALPGKALVTARFVFK